MKSYLKKVANVLKEVREPRHFIPALLVILSGHSRYQPELNWTSGFIIPNIFRLLEQILWRRHGVRTEATVHSEGISKEGIVTILRTTYKFHTLEAALLHIEAWIRGLLPKHIPFKIHVPILMTTFGPFFASPYLFAIAYDNSQADQFNATSSGTGTAFTIASGSVLYCSMTVANTNVDPNSVSWNTSESLTKRAAKNVTTAQSLWNIGTPTSGSHALSASFTGNHEFDIVGISFTGAATASTGGIGSGTSGTGTSLSMSLTTTAINSINVDSTFINGGVTVTATGTNQTNRVNFSHNVSSTWRTEVSTQTTTTIGTYSQSYSWGSSNLYDGVSMEVLAAVASTAKGNFLMFM